VALEHEARTHLTTIKLAAGLLGRQSDVTADQQRRAREISAAADRLCQVLEESAIRLREAVRTAARSEALIREADEALERSARVRSELEDLRESL
jgi:hypothetical protein